MFFYTWLVESSMVIQMRTLPIWLSFVAIRLKLRKPHVR